MKNLFIDTNVWLSLYSFSNDDLSQFEKLNDMLGKSINLIMTQQVIDEINRNRENKLQKALEDFELKNPKYPVFCQSYEQYGEFKTNFDGLMKLFKGWKEIISEDIDMYELSADKTIESFFNNVKPIDCDAYINKAYNRYRKGNPPGKDNKYGDAINWECLLDVVNNEEDLYLISTDKDYRSVLSKKELNPFLKKEWNDRKKSQIYFYTSLVEFLNIHVKEIDLINENEKNDLIEELYNSFNYYNTHSVIAKLNHYSDWTEAQVERMCEAAIQNTQVNDILTDTDVKAFYINLVKPYFIQKTEAGPISFTIELLQQHEQEAKLKLLEKIRLEYEAEKMEALEEYYNH